MSVIMTIHEIEDRYDGEWVLVGNPITDDQLNVVKGEVLLHHPDRDVFDREALKHKAKRFAVLSLRKTPEQMEYVL